MESKRFTLNSADIKSWLKNCLIFLIPVVVIYLTFVQGNCEDGFTLQDLVPNQIVLGTMVGYIAAELVALGKKFIEGK